MKRIICLVAALFLAPLPAPARDVAGQFDYYVLAFSWSPSWCSMSGDAQNAAQCRDGRGHDFVIHGLWPQYERGWPEYCATGQRDPARRETRAMADIMGSDGLAWHQWKKHGRCTGLSSAGYFALTRQAAQQIALPEVFSRLTRDITLPPAIVEEAFIEANPDLSRDSITVTCRAGELHEVRICLTRDLTPRDCAPDISRDCSLPRIRMEKPR